MFIKNYGALFLLCIIFSDAFAQGNNALAKAQYMIRQINAEKTALKQENSTLKKQLDELKKKVGGLEKESKNNSSALQSRLKAERQKSASSSQSLLQLGDELRAANDSKKILQNSVKQYSESLDLCIANNKSIYDIANKMTKEGLWKPARKSEPFLQLGRVKMENLAQDYQYEINDLLINQ